MTRNMKAKYNAVITCQKQTYERDNDRDKFTFKVWSIQCIAPNTFRTVLKCTEKETNRDCGFTESVNYFDFDTNEGILIAETNYKYSNANEVLFIN